MEELATTINSVASNLNCYFWRLSGDAPNSVCKFLGVEEAQLKVVLRLCKIYTGKKDNFSKKNFENFMLVLSPRDWTTFQFNCFDGASPCRMTSFFLAADNTPVAATLVGSFFSVSAKLTRERNG